MSMKNYAFLGYGINYEDIKKFINRSKLIDVTFNGELTEDEEVSLPNTTLLEEALQLQKGLLEFIYADTVEGYVLIWNTASWEMHHKDYQYLKTEKDAQEYIWEHLKDFLQPTLTKENFVKMLDYINDSYCG